MQHQSSTPPHIIITPYSQEEDDDCSELMPRSRPVPISQQPAMQQQQAVRVPPPSSSIGDSTTIEMERKGQQHDGMDEHQRLRKENNQLRTILRDLGLSSLLPWNENRNQQADEESSAHSSQLSVSFFQHLKNPHSNANANSNAITQDEILHNVNGIMCREVIIQIKKIGSVKVLEATAESQDQLVEMACATEEEISQSQNVQLIKSGDPYGAVLWPAASAVSDHLMTTVSEELPTNSLEGLTILELGTGTGLCALSAALGGAKRVIATDYEDVPLRLLEFAMDHINCEASSGEVGSGADADARRLKLSCIETQLFDICKHEVPLPKADIVIAADIMYEPKTGIAAAIRAVEALRAGSRVIIGCSPGRPGRPHFTEKLKELLPGVDTEFQVVEGRTCSGPRNELICGENSTSVSREPKPLDVALIDLIPEKCLQLLQE